MARTWTPEDRQKHSELMRSKLLAREWEPWKHTVDRSQQMRWRLQGGHSPDAS
ncbi:hypothetical protein [Leptolyngbya sp. FACHB-711]|uniref:hypothetical protein n=1 Tax=unclassified Leptolyngbya TaxID=2650499 RepID=UPI001684E4D5|nr:hypothetical protein [Leptolyngbya sp. FACHB-711]MBD2023485.1 hypothetical protein [Leptolyngbya sp. FACHB-711]